MPIHILRVDLVPSRLAAGGRRRDEAGPAAGADCPDVAGRSGHLGLPAAGDRGRAAAGCSSTDAGRHDIAARRAAAGTETRVTKS